MSKELSDSTLLFSALETLKMISTAHVFKDSYGSRVITVEWQELARKEANMIEYKLKLRADNEARTKLDLEEFGDKAEQAYQSKVDQDLENS